MNILHITDLHIDDPKSEKEALREAFYPEYLQSLVETIKADNLDIDFIFITGDIVNYAKVDNYSHASVILNHLADKLNVPQVNIYLTCGNHDIPKDTGNLDGFKAFSSQFNNSDELLESDNRFELYKIDENNAILCINSIGTYFKTGLPSPLGAKEEDRIVKLIRDNNFKDLYILSHHPAESYTTQNQAPFDEGDVNWSAEHIWHEGGSLYRRLSSQATINGNCFWFAGDVHRPEYCIVDGRRVLSVGSSLNITSEIQSSILPQVRIVFTKKINLSQLYTYQFTGHNRTGLEGAWESKQVEAHTFTLGKSVPDKQEQQNSSKKPPSHSNFKENDANIEQPHEINLISKVLDKYIHDKVIEKKLYDFGRFDTSSKLTSLSWVSIQGLLANYSLYSKMINAFKEKIDSLLPQNINRKNCLLVGVDSWGAILSSRLGAATNIHNCCIAVRSQRGSYDNTEIINKELKDIIREKLFVFVISDVISTGRSISIIRNEFRDYSTASWFNLTILCDPLQERGNSFEGYNGTYNLCGSIKMPIIEKHKLPELDMLSANISFL